MCLRSNRTWAVLASAFMSCKQLCVCCGTYMTVGSGQLILGGGFRSFLTNSPLHCGLLHSMAITCCVCRMLIPALMGTCYLFRAAALCRRLCVWPTMCPLRALGLRLICHWGTGTARAALCLRHDGAAAQAWVGAAVAALLHVKVAKLG